MSRSTFAPAVALLVCSLTASSAFGQAKSPPPPPSATPPPPAKFIRPIKGTATIDVILGVSKKVGQDIVTIIKVKNTSAGAISLLKVDEYWYDKKLNVVTGDSQPYRKPFNPGEIIEVTLKSPIKPNVELYRSQYQYSHANGDIKVKAVKKFD